MHSVLTELVAWEDRQDLPACAGLTGRSSRTALGDVGMASVADQVSARRRSTEAG
jgi:hypothetical protein